MFKRWFRRRPVVATSVFTANWEMSLQDPATFADDLAIHAIDEKDLAAFSLALEIRLDVEDRIVDVRAWQDGTPQSDQRSYATRRWEPLIGHQFPQPSRTQTPKLLVVSETGPHVLGGPIPAGLRIPRTQNPAGLQFVATLAPDGDLMPASEHPLHILCPLLLPGFGRLDLDYSDPLAPSLVDQSSFEADVALEGLDFDNIKDVYGITYKSVGVDVAPVTADPDLERAGIAGVPSWLQAPTLPRCPRTGQIMEFVAQFSGAAGLALVGKPFASVSSYFERLRTLDFWSGGTLFVFRAPASKVVSIFIQNT